MIHTVYVPKRKPSRGPGGGGWHFFVKVFHLRRTNDDGDWESGTGDGSWEGLGRERGNRQEPAGTDRNRQDWTGKDRKNNLSIHQIRKKDDRLNQKTPEFSHFLFLNLLFPEEKPEPNGTHHHRHRGNDLLERDG